VDGDLSSLTVVAQALLKVQMLFGVIPNVRSKGHCAKKVLQKMMSLRVEEVEQEQKLLQEQQSSLNSTQVPAGGAGGDRTGSEKNFIDSAGSAKSAAGNIRTAKRVADKYNSRSEIDLLVMSANNPSLIFRIVCFTPCCVVCFPLHRMDREVDLISPLVTPLTYEGLIDDTVGIEKGRVRLDASVLGSAEQQDAMSVKMAAQSGAEAAAAAGKCD